MSIPVTCTCGQQFMAQPHLAGQRLTCPNCGSPLVVPDPASEKPAPLEEAPSGNIVSCQCGQSFKAAPHLAGKRVPCPSCGQPIDIPGGHKREGAKSKPASSSPAAARSAVEETTESDSGLEWDDALAMPAGTAPLDSLGPGPPYAARPTAPEPIEPMTMYAIWIGGGAVVLLILVILGHIVWNAFADRERPGPAEPSQVDTEVESPPAEPATQAEPASPAPPKESAGATRMPGKRMPGPSTGRPKGLNRSPPTTPLTAGLSDRPASRRRSSRSSPVVA